MTCHYASNREYVSKQHTTSSFVFIHIYTSTRHCGLFQAWENYCAHAFRESVETKFFWGKFKTFCWSVLFLHLFASLGYTCYPLFKLAIQKIGNKVFPIQNQRFQLTAVQLFSPNVNEMTQARRYCSTIFSLLFWRDLCHRLGRMLERPKIADALKCTCLYLAREIQGRKRPPLLIGTIVLLRCKLGATKMYASFVPKNAEMRMAHKYTCSIDCVVLCTV